MNKNQATTMAQKIIDLLKDMDMLSKLHIEANTFSNGEWYVDLRATFTAKES